LQEIHYFKEPELERVGIIDATHGAGGTAV
jgi:hypothetical protein